MALDVILAEGLNHGVEAVLASPLTQSVAVLAIVGVIGYKVGKTLLAA